MPMANFCFLLLLLLPLLSSKPAFSESSLKPGFHFDLTHVDATWNFSKFEILRRGIKRDKTWIQNFNKMIISNLKVRMPVVEQRGSYLMNLSLGTPPISFSAIFDTGSDLVWTQCKPCLQCFKQPTPVYDPAQSSSFANATRSAALCKELTNSSSSNGCEYSFSYADESFTTGYLAFETLTLGGANQKVSTPDIAFGCGIKNHVKGLTQGAGIVGFNRGPLSLLSQLHIKKFSYCLSLNGTGSLVFGSSTSIDNTTNRAIKTTPLIQNPYNPSYYYLSLQGITVGQKYLPVPSSSFRLNTDGSGGMIIDSGTSMTYITEDVFDVLKPVFASQTNLQVIWSSIGLDLCFQLPSHNNSKLDVPDLIFHFEDLDLKLPVENYMVVNEELGIVCLAMGAAGGLSIFGSMQHQNMLVLHDLEKKVVSFIPTQCSQLDY
ncbi:aspartic proteinase nepenthesin-2-like [Benincasa hispida]|uniref:aspartic proteinase nepenthesin-2-like n=1 Tax=Benincasa hispida TaxID=102211 RepID=UPI001900F9AD|nr:aspartic proteinase nepenthesin-2-like [Benincasa hispida]